MLPCLSPSDLVALVNQSLDLTLPIIEVEGEVTEYRPSRKNWVFFDIADDTAKVKCFGLEYMLPAPLENGMKVKIVATPRLHPRNGFSLNIKSLQFIGEGTINKAQELLKKQLESEGLFAPERKRDVPYPPARIGLITSEESAAYKDFIKVISARWSGLEIVLADVQVQGSAAVEQVVRAIEQFNTQAELPDVLVVTRGGGSAEDLQAFSSEQVARAVAASRIPTVVAIGHEQDVSLAELGADLRASTPSNAAELLVPDRKDVLRALGSSVEQLDKSAQDLANDRLIYVEELMVSLHQDADSLLKSMQESLSVFVRTLEALSPRAILERGYAIVRSGSKAVVGVGAPNKITKLNRKTVAVTIK